MLCGIWNFSIAKNDDFKYAVDVSFHSLTVQTPLDVSDLHPKNSATEKNQEYNGELTNI